MEKSQKKKIIIICLAVLLIAVVVVVALLVPMNKKESYRLIKVYEVDGEAIISRKGVGDINAYQGMVLESEDKVVLKNGTMTLRLDDDKYVYVEPDTEFQLVATGNSVDSKTTIELNYGAIINDIQNALSDESSYEINTPNSNMSVRGTIFRVSTYYEDNVRYTRVSVFEGEVESLLKYADGSYSDNPVIITVGNEVLIFDDGTRTDYVGELKPINYDELPKSVIAALMKIVESGRELGITYEELSKYLESKSNGDVTKEVETTEAQTKEPAGPFTVTFMYNGNVFGTQIVAKGGYASEPRLMPAPSGNWDFDFSTEINSDTTIQWK